MWLAKLDTVPKYRWCHDIIQDFSHVLKQSALVNFHRCCPLFIRRSISERVWQHGLWDSFRCWSVSAAVTSSSYEKKRVLHEADVHMRSLIGGLSRCLIPCSRSGAGLCRWYWRCHTRTQTSLNVPVPPPDLRQSGKLRGTIACATTLVLVELGICGLWAHMLI